MVVIIGQTTFHILRKCNFIINAYYKHVINVLGVGDGAPGYTPLYLCVWTRGSVSVVNRVHIRGQPRQAGGLVKFYG